MYRSNLRNCKNLELTEYKHANTYSLQKENSIAQSYNKTNEVCFGIKNLQAIYYITIIHSYSNLDNKRSSIIKFQSPGDWLATWCKLLRKVRHKKVYESMNFNTFGTTPKYTCDYCACNPKPCPGIKYTPILTYKHL